ncbi:hypothetical protein [Eubacterium maltosivorans]|uniref:Uncharacterized protein n=1 Tax=Eubacterium maltosivorans TaxID=2041044 RepID=A0A4P9C785_EUBML|nr:hypothetical protein [Eubacterium maltosivorans]QCT71378.1 hypothetical protein CPZ25_008560 [Eubacterium maltosivorans]
MEYIKHTLTKKYIGQDNILTQIIENAIKAHQVIFFIAPQGTGKSHYISSLRIKGVCEDIKIINPTTALSKQNRQTQIIAEQGDIFLDESEVSSQTFVTSGLETKQNDDINKNILVYVDEPHKIVQYATFAYQEQTHPVIKAIETYLKNGNAAIMTTATPELFYCLEKTELYNKIDLCIEVEKEMNYLEKVNIWTMYSEDHLKKELIKNYKETHLQIALVNDTKAIEKIEKELKEVYNIKTIGITSKNRTLQDTEHFKQFQDLVETGEINQYNILLATSWVDSGITFVNENITDLYCILHNNYRMGDFTMIKQFLARARQSKPTLHIVAPKLTDREERLINLSITLYSGDVLTDKETLDSLSVQTRDELIQSVQTIDGETDHKTVYKKLITCLTEKNHEYIKDYQNGILDKSNLKGIYGIIEKDGEFEHSDIALKYEIHRIIEKLECQKDIQAYIKNLTNCDNIHVIQPDKDRNKNAVFHLCTQQEQIEIIDYLDTLVDSQESFKQEEVTQQLNELSQGKIDGKNLNPIFKNNDLPYKADRIREGNYRLIKKDSTK